MILSIIIPVYNVEKYVEKCIRSCENQDIPKEDYEVIVVNDGSPDGSLAIVERVAKEYPNIKVISQENQGLSGARNTGLAAAQGEYVWFVDSDDWIEENCLKCIVLQCFDKNLDALQIGAESVSEMARKKWFSWGYEGIRNGKELLNTSLYDVSVPFTIYKRKLLTENKLYMYSGIFHEDNEFTPRAYYYAERVSLETQTIYYVRVNMHSITHTVNIKRAFDLVLVASNLDAFEKSSANECKKGFATIISISLNSALGMVKYMDVKKRIEFDNLLYSHHCLYNRMKQSSKFQHRLEGLIFSICPKHPSKIYSLISGLK